MSNHRAWLLLLLVLSVLFAPSGCTCGPDLLIPERRPLLICRSHALPRPAAAPVVPNVKTVSAGTIPHSFSVTRTGGASLVMPLTAVPGRAGIEPDLALTYDSEASRVDGVLGVGFSLGGLSAITRCPSTLAEDGEIRAVRYDAADQVCFSGRRLVAVGSTPTEIEFRTKPDSFTRIVGHYASERDQPGNALSFEIFLPSGLVIEAGTSEATRPLAKGGVAQAWLAETLRDGRGNAMTYDYCFADDPDGGYTAEYALDEIRYTAFEGSPALPPSRTVKLVYGTKHPGDIRTLYAGNMALQSSLQLDEIRMLGPEDRLARRYTFTYDLGPATHRTRLTQVEECAADGVCKPPMHLQYSGTEAGFEKITTPIPTPVSQRSSPLLVDLDGDGLDDLLSPDMDPALSTPEHPITQWLIAHNQGKAPYLTATGLAFSETWPTVSDPQMPSDPTHLLPEMGTTLDYNHDRRADVLLHDVYDSRHTWQLLIAQSDGTFQVEDSGIPRPFPLFGGRPMPPALTAKGISTHLADLDGDGMIDLLQCVDHSDHQGGDPGAPSWTVHLWTPDGFEPAGTTFADLDGYLCNTELYTVDIDADGKVDILVGNGGPMIVPTATYLGFSRTHDGTFRAFDTELPLIQVGGRVIFLDINGDGLPDGVEGGFSDGFIRVYINQGKTFFWYPLDALKKEGISAHDTYFDLAVPLDFNGDGRQDLLMPLPDMVADGDQALPAWRILLSTGGTEETVFRVVDPQIPFEAEIDQAFSLADPHVPRIGDIDGDGAHDVLLPLSGFFTIFRNRAADQDLLLAVSDGLNAHDPEDQGFVPNVAISYGHLDDPSVTAGLDPADPAREGMLYLSHADADNGCDYPRACAVGARRAVAGYALNNGADGERRFSVRYRDGRFDRRGFGFLGFGERIITDLDTGTGAADFYDNHTFDKMLAAYPHLGQIVRAWRWHPALPGAPDPSKIELTFTDLTFTVTPTSGSATYFSLPTNRRVRRAQGSVKGDVESYVRAAEAGSAGASVLLDMTAKVSEFDVFGHVLVEDVTAEGLDLSFHIERGYKNDTERWVLGQLQSQSECSGTSMLSRCRLLGRMTTIYGEVESENVSSDDGSPDVVLSTVYGRDPFGNVESITEEDAFDHHRVTLTAYEPEGIYPYQHTNAEKHVSITEYDPAFGVMTKHIDPNQLVTTWDYDGFGRLGKESRPDKTETTVTLAREKKGGAWVTSERSTTPGGADEQVVLDGKGREIRRFWHGPEPTKDVARLMQVIAYDALGEHVEKRSVPVREGTKESALLFDEYFYDGIGREIEHIAPWGLHVMTSYDGSTVTVTDSAGSKTVSEVDPIGRPVTVTDAGQGVTSYTYGPFGYLYEVIDPIGALTRTTRDALGRIQRAEDSDRGETLSTHDGFGELVSTKDALMRMNTYEYDGLGRPLSHTPHGAGPPKVTTWTWDKAEHGIGRLQALAGPDGTKTYTYNEASKTKTITLAVAGQADSFTGKLDYDTFGRVSAITYPTPEGAPAFVVAQDYDAHGYLLSARDRATDLAYWHLTDVDEAGRYRQERLGKEIITTRSYFADKQRIKSISTEHDGKDVQLLSYDYDQRRNLRSRTDALQTQNPVERFRYDSLDRLTCAYFGMIESPGAPCASSYAYDPSGNLTFKSEVGALSYGDLAHPHAVTGAGGASYGYDAAGNQTSRPGGMAITYTGFDLPATITQGASSFSFGYDGDERRIRKTTPEEETLYFEDLYERVTSIDAPVEHRYYVRSPERVVAIVTHGGAKPGTRYLHADNLGSTDAVTDETGSVVERRSYDAFGQRRNPEWGKPPPVAFSSLTSVSFTGHEDDGDLGLLNMRGRMFDPKLGRFLTMDPIVQAASSSQGLNPYSYVLNNPLTHMDPSGFDPDKEPILPIQERHYIDNEGSLNVDMKYPPHGAKPAEKTDPKQDGQSSGAVKPPVDVGTTGPGGNQPGTRPDCTYPQHDSPGADFALGTVEGFGEAFFDAAKGLALTALTFGGYATYSLWRSVYEGYEEDGPIGALNGPNPIHALLREAAVASLAADDGDYRTVGRAVGRVVFTVVAAIVAKKTLAKAQSSAAARAKPGIAGGPTAGQRFAEGVRQEAFAENPSKTCVFCRREGTATQVDHATPRARGGAATIENAQLSCPHCNASKGAGDFPKTPPEGYEGPWPPNP
ncbi:MAG: FG-GAP-like repeat-containing protein [Byssovorax sp.]